MADDAPHRVTLTVAGREFGAWEDVAIRRSLDALTGSFSLTAALRESTEGEEKRIRPLDEVTLSIDGAQLMAGLVYSVAPALLAADHVRTVSGRDKAADLVDCAAIAGAGSWKNARMETIVAELLKPFGLKSKFTASSGAPIKRFAIQQGETVHAAIERLCRLRAFVAWSEADGTVMIGNPTGGESAGKLVEGENLLSCEANHDASDRYSVYIVKGQSSADDHANGKAVSQLKAEAKDPAITRYRPLIIIAEDQADAATLKKRAQWEANVRAARGQSATVTLRGWHDPSGNVWRPTTKVQLVAPTCDIDSMMLVVSAELVRNNQEGTIARLELQRPEAWQQLAVPEEAESGAIRRKKRS